MQTIRPATMSDTEALESLIAESVRALAADDYTPEQIEGALQRAWGLDTQLIRDATYFAVERDGVLAGCGGWSFRKTLFGNDAEANRDGSLADPATDPAKIRAFFVHPEYARRGIGTLLMRACEAQARARGFRRLELMATLPGVRLYVAHGFEAGAPIEYSLGSGLSIEFVPMTKALS